MSNPSRVVAVFASSAADVAPHYRQLAEELGTRIGARGWTLLYGGTLTGMMRSMADAARATGGQVVAIALQQFVDVGIHDLDADELVVTVDLYERKRAMLERADAFVVLPGGFGTLDEAIEVLAWRRIGVLDKPLVFVDHGGYWAPLLGQIELMAREGMLARGDAPAAESPALDVPGGSEELRRARRARHPGYEVAETPAVVEATLLHHFAGE